jgi:glycosyltransferase involved in cell wall biosynthesis
MTGSRLRVGVLATHPIQYYCPWYRALAKTVDLEVFFSHRQTSSEQASAGFGVEFDWDVPLLEGFHSTFLPNAARHPSVNTFAGCHTPALAGIIRDRKFDAFIVHGWYTRSFWQAMIACWRTGTPILVRGDSTLGTPRASWWRLLKEPLFPLFISRFDGYLVVGDRAREYLVHYGANPSRCFNAPHSVDNQFFASLSNEARLERGGLRRHFGLPEHAVVFLFAGRFVDRKRPDWFVRAVARAAADDRTIAALVVGDGPLRARAEALARELKAPIQFAGFLNQTEMVRAYTVSDVLVVPSTWETWGLVVNEAMACGVPAIVSQGVACADDLVVQGVTGEVFPVDAEDALALSIARVARDAYYRDRLSRQSREHVAKYDITVAAEGTVRAIQSLVSGRPDRTGAHRPSTPAIGRAH